MNAVEMVPRKGCYITNLGEEKVRPEKGVLYNAWTEGVKGLEQYKKEVEEFVMTVILTNEEKRWLPDNTTILSMCEASLKNERRKEKEIKDLMSYERKQYPDFDLEWLEREKECNKFIIRLLNKRIRKEKRNEIEEVQNESDFPAGKRV